AELVRRHHVVVVHRAVRGDGVGGRVERDQPGRGLRVDRGGLAGRVGHRDPAVDEHVVVAAHGDLVAEVGDGDAGPVAGEPGHQRGQVAVGVAPGGLAVVVDAVAVGGAGDRRRAGAAGPAAGPAGVDPEAAAQAADHALAVAGPADRAGVAERAVHGLAAGGSV